MFGKTKSDETSTEQIRMAFPVFITNATTAASPVVDMICIFMYMYCLALVCIAHVLEDLFETQTFLEQFRPPRTISMAFYVQLALTKKSDHEESRRDTCAIAPR